MAFTLEVWIIIALALAFDFSNGFHDAANSIATVVSTRVLSPRVAVVWAGFFNFVAFTVLGTHVAKTIGKGVINSSIVTPHILLAALVGGLVGSAVVAAGPHAVVVSGITTIAEFIVLSPLIGLALGFVLMTIVNNLVYSSTPRRVDKLFRRLQLFSAAGFSLGHGGNDAQKTMGIITALLYSTGRLSGEFHVPFWVELLSYTAMGLGTMSGGWRIVRTMGMKLTKLQPVGGFCAETAGSITLFVTALSGIPVSTTHTITGAIVGVGATRRFSAVKWGVAGRIVWAWVLTLPMAALMSGLVYLGIVAAFGR